jgi:hypothetical protein
MKEEEAFSLGIYVNVHTLTRDAKPSYNFYTFTLLYYFVFCKRVPLNCINHSTVPKNVDYFKPNALSMGM